MKWVDYYVIEQNGGSILVRETSFVPVQYNKLISKPFAEQVTEPIVKKWRGRPKKEVIVWLDMEEEQPIKRGRWRPKKIKLEQSWEVKPKRKRRTKLEMQESRTNTLAKMTEPEPIQELEPVQQQEDFFNINQDVPAYEWTQIFNLTWHVVSFASGYSIPAHGRIRISENEMLIGYVNDIPVYENQLVPSTLPKEQPGKIYIVSNMVCLANPDRADLFIPHRVQYSAGYCLWLCRNPYFSSSNQPN